MTLYQISEDLEKLAEFREQFAEQGDSVALKAIDIVIGEYLEDRQPAKVDSYAALIHRYEDDTEACKREADRLYDRAKRNAAEAQRLKNLALGTMQRFGITELKSPTNSIKRVTSGGKQALEVYDPLQIQLGYRKFTLKLDAETYMAIRECVIAEAGADSVPFAAVDAATFEPDNERIREALAQQVVCPECAGKGRLSFEQPLENGDEEQYFADCKRCNGKGVIPNSVPGARLKPRGETVRLS